MKEYTKKPAQASRTLDSSPRVSRQAPVSELLQMRKDSGEATQFCGRRLGAATTAPIPDKLEYGASAMATTAAMLTYKKGEEKPIEERRYGSGGGMHAEEKVLEDLTRATHDHIYTPDNEYEVVLFVSKSPCTSSGAHPTRTDGHEGCTEQLTKATNIAGVPFHITVAPTKLYGGSGEKQDASQTALDSMRGSGMDVFSPTRKTGKPGGK